MNDWIEIRTTGIHPEFDVPVLCYCRIYGRYIGWYERINGTGWGQWCDGKAHGVLPPTHWTKLLDSPKTRDND